MTSESAKRMEFKSKISSRLEVLLQISLSLTKNGRDAIRLLREAITEASQSWDEAMLEESCDIRLNEIMTREFYSNLRQYSRPLAPIHDESIGEPLDRNNRLFPAKTTVTRQNSLLTDESHEHVQFLKAIMSLPPVFQSVMILSYLKGFSNAEIAKLAGVRPHVIELLLYRGFGLLRERFLAYLLMGTDGLNRVEEQAVATG
jgi:hypothetical protein